MYLEGIANILHRRIISKLKNYTHKPLLTPHCLLKFQILGAYLKPSISSPKFSSPTLPPIFVGYMLPLSPSTFHLLGIFLHQFSFLSSHLATKNTVLFLHHRCGSGRFYSKRTLLKSKGNIKCYDNSPVSETEICLRSNTDKLSSPDNCILDPDELVKHYRYITWCLRVSRASRRHMMLFFG